ncbi:hypothetical protein DOT_6027 [Desulfosporosinus sp. OT]|nr:hypothetical protein DOT_6027 [Desulfosporosinus sp. OT]
MSSDDALTSNVFVRVLAGGWCFWHDNLQWRVSPKPRIPKGMLSGVG